VKDATLAILRPLIQSDETISSEQASRALDILTGKLEEPRHPEPERYMTLKAVGQALGISSCTLWRWGVPGHDLGGRRRFRISEVQAYLNSEEMKKRAAELKQERKGKL
jgi:predicted DNA-binding transcriptional regulator AlpA